MIRDRRICGAESDSAWLTKLGTSTPIIITSCDILDRYKSTSSPSRIPQTMLKHKLSFINPSPRSPVPLLPAQTEHLCPPLLETSNSCTLSRTPTPRRNDQFSSNTADPGPQIATRTSCPYSLQVGTQASLSALVVMGIVSTTRTRKCSSPKKRPLPRTSLPESSMSPPNTTSPRFSVAGYIELRSRSRICSGPHRRVSHLRLVLGLR